MNIGWNYQREHLRIQQRSHYVVTDGGDQPNVVPSNATVWYYFRETDYPHIKEMWDFGNKMAEGAALMTVTTWTSRILGAAWPQHFNKPVAEAMDANIQQVGLPPWSDDDQTLAQARAEGDRRADAERARHRARPRWRSRCKDEDKRGGGSDDIGDVSWTVPDGHAALPVEHPRPARPQLGERHRHGDADRAQGRRGRRQGAGDDDRSTC